MTDQGRLSFFPRRGASARAMRRFCRDRSAAIAIMFALFMPVMLACGAIAVDVGSLYLQRRDLQAATDAAALAAAWKPEAAEANVRQLLDAHGFSAATFTISRGSYDEFTPDPTKRFTASGLGSGARVDAVFKAPVAFARIFQMRSAEISVRAEAATIPIVSMSAGSRLASVGSSPLSGLTKGILGLDLGLSAADYRNLAQTHIEFGPLLGAVLDAGLVETTTDVLARDVLSVPIKLSVLLSLMSREVDKSGNLMAGSVLRKAAQETLAANVTVKLGDMINVADGIGGLSVAYPSSALNADISALGLLNAAIHQKGVGSSVKTNLKVPGVLEAGVELLLGEGAQSARSLAVSDAFPAISTDQIRLRLGIETTGVLDALNVGVAIPIELAAAGGTAEVVSVNCDSDPLKREVKVAVRPGVLRLSLGEFKGKLKDIGVNDELGPADLVRLLVVTITGQANIAVKPPAPIYLTFKGTEIGSSLVKTAKVTTIAQSLVTSLLQQTKLRPKVLGLVLNLDGLLSAVAGVLSTVTPTIDGLLNHVLSLVGVSLGEMDVEIDSLSCGVPKIVG